MKAVCILGTRAEAVKFAPLIIELKKRRDPGCVVVLTGQHGRAAERVLASYGVRAHYDLESDGSRGLGLTAARIISRLTPVLMSESPSCALVQGDTVSALAGAVAAFFLGIPVFHVEAGLRTGDPRAPFPEEAARAMIARVASLNFAPDRIAAENLCTENVPGEIHTVGNTVADALALDWNYGPPPFFRGRPAVIVTSHRRENIGEPLINICDAVAQLSASHPEYEYIFPVHPNPAVSSIVGERLSRVPGVRVIPALGVREMHSLLLRSHLIMTDSGGLCEEGAIAGVPVIVLRSRTERVSLEQSGKLLVSGVERAGIISAFERLCDPALYMKMKCARDPVCECGASARIVGIMSEYLHKVN